MTDNELLLALSGMLDKKLKAELQPIRNELQEMKKDIAGLNGEIAGIKDEIADMKSEMAVMKADIADMKVDIAVMKADIRKLQLCQENVILPRLDTIESCYTDTFRRYSTYADKMDSVFEDVELIKSVVTSHSEKLQKLA